MHLLASKVPPVHHSNTGVSSGGVSKADGGNAIRFAIEEDNVGDFAELGALLTNVFTNVEQRCRVILHLVSTSR